MVGIKSTHKRALSDDNSADFVFIPPTWKFDPNKLTEHQKDALKSKKADIPALYNDLSRSQDSSSLKPWTPKQMSVDLKNGAEVKSSPAKNGIIAKVERRQGAENENHTSGRKKPRKASKKELQRLVIDTIQGKGTPKKGRTRSSLSKSPATPDTPSRKSDRAIKRNRKYEQEEKAVTPKRVRSGSKKKLKGSSENSQKRISNMEGIENDDACSLPSESDVFGTKSSSCKLLLGDTNELEDDLDDEPLAQPLPASQGSTDETDDAVADIDSTALSTSEKKKLDAIEEQDMEMEESLIIDEMKEKADRNILDNASSNCVVKSETANIEIPFENTEEIINPTDNVNCVKPEIKIVNDDKQMEVTVAKADVVEPSTKLLILPINSIGEDTDNSNKIEELEREPPMESMKHETLARPVQKKLFNSVIAPFNSGKNTLHNYFSPIKVASDPPIDVKEASTPVQEANVCAAAQDSKRNNITQILKSPLMSRSALILKLALEKKTNSNDKTMTPNSPVPNSISIMDEPLYKSQLKESRILTHEDEDDDPDLLKFGKSMPPLTAVSPNLSILKRKLNADSDSEADTPNSKRKRVSFNDPLTQMKRYIKDENEKNHFLPLKMLVNRSKKYMVQRNRRTNSEVMAHLASMNGEVLAVEKPMPQNEQNSSATNGNTSENEETETAVVEKDVDFNEQTDIQIDESSELKDLGKSVEKDQSIAPELIETDIEMIVDCIVEESLKSVPEDVEVKVEEHEFGELIEMPVAEQKISFENQSELLDYVFDNFTMDELFKRYFNLASSDVGQDERQKKLFKLLAFTDCLRSRIMQQMISKMNNKEFDKMLSETIENIANPSY